MADLPLRARVFWWLVVLAGGAVSVVAVVGSSGLLLGGSVELALGTLGVLTAGAVAQGYRVWLPNPRRPIGAYVGARRAGDPVHRHPSEWETTSVSSAVFVFGLLALPVPLAIATVVLATALAGLRSRGRRWYQRLFNSAQYALAIGIAGVIWEQGRSADRQLWSDLLWVAPTLAAYFVVNSGAVATMLALVEELPVLFVWRRGRRTLLSSYLLLLMGGVLFWLLWEDGSLLPGGAAVLFGVAAVYRSARHTVLIRQQTIDALADLADLMDQRDYYTHQHSLRVGQYAERLAAALGLPQEQAGLIFLCGRLHDIGKCAVSNEVLLKPGPLTPDERLEMCRHAEIGGQMLAHFDQFKLGASYVRSHHEWYDGSGYPDGLARSAIPIGARIIAVADAYDAMTTDRPYRRALPRAEAIRRLLDGAGTQWDPRVVHAFVGLLGYVPPLRPFERSPVAEPALAGAAAS